MNLWNEKKLALSDIGEEFRLAQESCLDDLALTTRGNAASFAILLVLRGNKHASHSKLTTHNLQCFLDEGPVLCE